MKYYGAIGYAETKETRPGVYEEVVTERYYYGDVTRNTGKWQAGQNLNDNLDVDNALSLVADPFAFEHLGAIRYVEWNGAKWKVKSVEQVYPRINLTIGGVYNA